MPVRMAFKIVTVLDMASHYVPALVPLYVRAFHWSEDIAQAKLH